MSDLDAQAVAQAADVIREVVAEALRGALCDVALGRPDSGEQEALSPEEQSLVEKYRTAGEQHRVGAMRLLERGQPAKDAP